MRRETDRAMGNREQTILIVSDDAALCAAARREFEASIAGVRVASVSSVAAARRILEEESPVAILLEEAAMVPEADKLQGILPRLDAVVTSLAVYAPVVVIGTAALGLIRSRLRQAQRVADSAHEPFEDAAEDFGQVLRHELNNPLTGILGNAELLLAEVHRKNDGTLPHGGEHRLETIAALAVRLRETVRRLSQEWEARQHTVH